MCVCVCECVRAVMKVCLIHWNKKKRCLVSSPFFFWGGGLFCKSWKRGRNVSNNRPFWNFFLSNLDIWNIYTSGNIFTPWTFIKIGKPKFIYHTSSSEPNIFINFVKYCKMGSVKNLIVKKCTSVYQWPNLTGDWQFKFPTSNFLASIHRLPTGYL